MSRSMAGLIIWTSNDNGSAYVVDPKHYDDLKNRLDHKDTGWIELDHIFGDAKLFVNLEDICEMFLATESYCREHDEWHAINE